MRAILSTIAPALRLLLGLLPALSAAAAAPETASLERGALTYKERCLLCHGSRGMGEGLLPLSIDTYPNTNLRTGERPDDVATIAAVVRHGGAPVRSSDYSPPWIEEIPYRGIVDVSHFVSLLQRDAAAAAALLADIEHVTAPREARQIFATRCATCHGARGEGDGRMAKLLRTPPPADLTRSGASLDDVVEIITAGGAAVDRSPNMPPWGQELLPEQIDSLARYVLKLRETAGPTGGRPGDGATEHDN